MRKKWSIIRNRYLGIRVKLVCLRSNTIEFEYGCRRTTMLAMRESVSSDDIIRFLHVFEPLLISPSKTCGQTLFEA